MICSMQNANGINLIPQVFKGLKLFADLLSLVVFPRLNVSHHLHAFGWIDTHATTCKSNDIEVTQPDWLDALVEHGQRPAIGAVGGRLLYPALAGPVSDVEYALPC